MKKIILFLAIFISYSFSILNGTGMITGKKYPVTFTILKSECDNLFKYKVNNVIVMPKNKYINKSVVQRNTLTGDTKFLKLKLKYFPHAYLSIQVNGIYTTQIFLISGDKSVFYKGTLKENTILMTKCTEDDIVSE